MKKIIVCFVCLFSVLLTACGSGDSTVKESSDVSAVTSTADYIVEEYIAAFGANQAYTLEIPSGWSTYTSDNGVNYGDPAYSITAFCGEFPLENITPENCDSIIMALTERAYQDDDFTIYDRYTDGVFGLTGYIMEGTFTSDDERDYNFMTIGLPMNNAMAMVTVRWPTSLDIGDTADTIIHSIVIPEENTVAYAAETITGIEAEYTGSTEAGIVLDNKNTDLHVYNVYLNGQKEEITDYEITEPQTLTAEQDSTIEITYGDFSTTLTVTCTTIDIAGFKNSCESISYDDLARYPDDYSGKQLKIYGRVLQVIEGSDGLIQMRVATGRTSYGSWYDDVVYVLYTYSDGEGKILEDDMITFYGYSTNTITYQSALGSSITIPSMLAVYRD